MTRPAEKIYLVAQIERFHTSFWSGCGGTLVGGCTRRTITPRAAQADDCIGHRMTYTCMVMSCVSPFACPRACMTSTSRGTWNGRLCSLARLPSLPRCCLQLHEPCTAFDPRIRGRTAKEHCRLVFALLLGIRIPSLLFAFISSLVSSA